MDLEKLWQLLKPTVVVIVSIIGMLVSDFPEVEWFLFFLILLMLIAFRGGSIMDGLSEIIKMI